MGSMYSYSEKPASVATQTAGAHSFRLYAAVFTICILILAAAALEMGQLRANVTDRIQGKTKNIAISVTQTMDGLIDMMDVALLASADVIATSRHSNAPDHSAISQYLVEQTPRLPHVAYLRGTDPSGNIVYGPGVSGIAVNLSDREFFVKLRDNKAQGLYMAKPVISKVSGQPVVIFARRVNNPDGSFGGTVYGAILLEELAHILSAIEMNSGGSIALRDRDLGCVARHVFGAANVVPQGDTHISTPFREALNNNPNEGSYVSDATSTDDVPRIYSYRVSTKYGYLINVGERVDFAFAQANQQSTVVAAFAVLLCLSIALLAWRTVRARARQERLFCNLAESNRLVQQQEQRHRLLLTNLHTGIVVHAANSNITFSNAQAWKLLGLSEQQLQGKTTVDPTWRLVDIQGNTLAVEDYPVSKVIASKHALDSQVIGVTMPGNAGLVWLDVGVVPEFDGNGALMQVVANFHDITPRILAEQASKRAARALRLLSDTNMAIARHEHKLALLEEVCRLVCVRGGYLIALVGFAQDDAQQSVQVIAQHGLSEPDLSGVQISWNASSEYGRGTTGTAIRSGKSHINRDLDEHPDMAAWHARAKRFGFRSSIAIPFFKKTGKRGALMLYAAEVDAFNADEVALLEELSINLAHGLDALEDQQRRIQAESAAQAKTDFLANMSHEIRTPLNAINGMAYLIRRDGLTPAQTLKLDKLEHASKHLLAIVTDILDLSKIDANKLEIEETPLRVETIVSDVVSMLLEKAQSKNIALHTELAVLPQNLRGDFTRLQQALSNYVTNAIKFTESGQVIIRASVLEETDESALLRFEVSDTGIGISQSSLERLFSAFEQADNSMTRRYGGTGLGLAITKKLALLMGGTAGAESQAGVGSTFWFTARLRKQEGLESQTTQPSIADPKELLRAKYPGLRALVAEDEPLNAEIARIRLEDIGFTVDVAEDGQAALECASKFPYQLILMDVQMPRMDGLDATRAIRRLPSHAGTPIIGCTGNAFTEVRVRCMEAGMTGFVTKPVMPDVLYSTIFEALESGRTP